MPVSLPRPCAKYLRDHAEPDAGAAALIDCAAAAIGAGVFGHVAVIPAFAEGDSLDRAIASVLAAARDEPALVVVCVNRRASSPPAVAAMNAETCARLAATYPQVAAAGSGSAHVAGAGAVVIVHATLPDDQGVGLARKVGVDLALRGWAAGTVRARWIHCTDADAVVPADYFSQGAALAGAALVHPFAHVTADAALDEAIAVYEIWLRYHVLGLRHAGSPYAFHTIGSTIAVAPEAYAKVRGFPRRAAAEDFYLLNKLAKCGPIATAEGAPIALQGRVSDRVPFGTGRAMTAAARDGVAGLPRFTPPGAFDRLGALIDACERALDGGGDVPRTDATDAIGLAHGLDQARRASASPRVRRRRFHEWLDGFRTLKLLHGWRDAAPPVTLADALAAPFATGGDDPDRRAIAALRPRAGLS